MRFTTLEIKSISQETPDCVSVEFIVPEDSLDKFQFKSGQYLTLKKTINDEELRRSYSICSAPQDGVLKVAIKKVEGGKFSTYANNELKVGDVIESMKPMGRFSPRTIKESPKYLMCAAGSGITPVLSIIKTSLLIILFLEKNWKRLKTFI